MQSMTINGNPITYAEAGDAQAPTLVLLSGWCQDHRLFKNLMPLLAQHYHVLCPDWRGHNPQQEYDGDFVANDLVNDVEVFLEKKHVSRFVPVSHSHGCWVNADLCERLGAERVPRSVVIDWLMAPHPGFQRQLRDGQHPVDYAAGRQSFFDEWADATDNADVINHIRNEMSSFHGEMWIRSCREIERAYEQWGAPLQRLAALQPPRPFLHMYSQPHDPKYQQLQEAFSADHPWFESRRIPGKTHFPTLESAPQLAAAIRGFVG